MTFENRLGELRARRALDLAGLDANRELVPIESATNEVWAAGDVVVRVNRTTRPRLRREGQIAGFLPRAVLAPEVVAFGTESGDDWIVLRRVPGTPLVRCWPGMTPAERRRAVEQVAAAVKALHGTAAPPVLDPPHDHPHLLQLGPRATEPLLAALSRAAELPHVDRGAIDEVAAWVRANRSALDPFESSTFVHGDLHFQNVLWDGERVTALLDLEYARAAPPDVDLDVLLRFCVLPYLYVPVGREAEAAADAYAEVPWWFRDAYPEVFSHPRLLDRLRLYAVAFDTTELLANPPTRPAAELTRDHPYRRLLATVRGTGHLDLLAAR